MNLKTKLLSTIGAAGALAATLYTTLPERAPEAAPSLWPIVQQVAAERPDLLETNINSTCFEFVTLVLQRANDPRWGHVGKTPGEGQYTPPTWPQGVDDQDPSQAGVQAKGRDGVFYTLSGASHDALFFKDGAIEQQVDILGRGNDGPAPIYDSAGNRITAVAQWGIIPPEHYRVNNPWLKAIAPSGGGGSPPTCPPCKMAAYPGDPVFDQIAVVLFADYASAGQAPNPGMGRWFGRTTYDWLAGNTATLEESIKKHRAEWCAILTTCTP